MIIYPSVGDFGIAIDLSARYVSSSAGMMWGCG
jgi:hypothetical protein